MNLNLDFKLFVAICLFLVCPVGVAYEVSPISVLMEPSGRNAIKDIKVINRGAAPIAIEIVMVTRKQNLDGSEQKNSADSEFVIYPQQMVIKGGSSQSVRIQWLGEQHVSLEKNYRFIVKQVPVNLKYANSAEKALKFNLTMEGSLYIRPENAKSNIIIKSAKVHQGKVHLIFNNKGNSHSFLNNLTVTLNQGQREVILKGKVLSRIEKKNVLAGASRRFVIPLPNGFNSTAPITASARYSEMHSY